MHGLFRIWASPLALIALLSTAAVSLAGDLYSKNAAPTDAVALPKASDIHNLTVYPTAITLRGSDDARQLILTAALAGGRQQDLTGDVNYEVSNSKIVRVTSAGRVLPVGNGTTAIRATFAGRSLTVPVTVSAMGENLPINFTNQIVPIFTKLGCNAGGCHGKASGQNGFKLSLLGFEPTVDFTALVKEARGRRLFPAAPDHSLLLLKATGQIAHGGGKRMDIGSDEYKLLRRWIAAGAPFGKPNDPYVTSISVFPDHRILTRDNKQQMAVFAHYNDGTVEDITRRAQYDSNDTEISTVEPSGLVHTLKMSGEAAIMARYQAKVTVFRVTVPLGVPVPHYDFPIQTVVDKYTLKKWQELGLVPSPLCTDAEFIRRASLDITGTLPTPTQVAAFVNNADSKKRDKLVDALLDRPEYSYLFANQWADILRVKRRGQANRAQGTFAFHEWIREAIATDKPYNEFVRDILGAVGDENKSPPTVWYKELMNPEQFVDDTAQVFLGQRLACAQCHHHPYEKWSQDDFWGLAAFFGRLGRKNLPVPGGFQGQQNTLQIVYNRPSGTVINKRTGKPAVMKTLDGPPLKVGPDDDPRQKLLDWMVSPKNPYFARAVANRYWAHFLGRGIVDPLDDMRVTNPPSNPELLDALANDLMTHGYSLKHLIGTICKSRTYQLSSVPNRFNEHDKQAYARFYPRRMPAEVLLDAVCQVTGSPTIFNGLPQDEHAPKRAIMLPDESFTSYFLDVFGRPQRISACECERVGDANLAQALHLLNSDEVQNKLDRPGSRADQLVKDKRSEADKVDDMVMWAFGRKATPTERQAALAQIQRDAKNKKAAYEDILWTLINTKEFVFNK